MEKIEIEKNKSCVDAQMVKMESMNGYFTLDRVY